ncbi:hypothetical protein ACFOD3_12945 [Falsiroseomonas tokyonensis]|uniref:Uncharacterized protein n=2 Tax=Falsiroseomonas tokyonensis TaxID=430521 RepID=A0ABV7BSY4_9PROT|nr:hypothetical protein [Falsiroseomonas tokyonensis]
MTVRDLRGPDRAARMVSMEMPSVVPAVKCLGDAMFTLATGRAAPANPSGAN